MNLVQLMFYLMAALAVGSALYVAATPNLVRSVFMFFITLFALAGLYVLSMADYVAITQVVVYVGGILVLVLFAFMLSGRETLAMAMQAKARWFAVINWPAFVLAILVFVVLMYTFLKADVSQLAWVNTAVANNNVITANDVMTPNLGFNLMGRYLLPFEVISVLLLMALAGAAHLSRKEPAE